MDTLVKTLALIAGLSFGIWPGMLGKSNLGANAGSLAWALIAALVIAPFAFSQTGTFFSSQTKWWYVIGAGVLGGVGILCLNGAIIRTDFTPRQIATVLVLMIGAQTVFAAVYGTFMGTEKISLGDTLGFVLVGAGALILTWKK